MVTHMKTTVDISDALLDDARKMADRRGVTLRALIEEGLRHVVKSGARRPRFTLRDASFAGDGLSPEFADGDWERIREAVYKGRGA
jgi:Bacterial antitoxin of type II TA system, VapB